MFPSTSLSCNVTVPQTLPAETLGVILIEFS
jgi:hypothetical protein